MLKDVIKDEMREVRVTERVVQNRRKWGRKSVAFPSEVGSRRSKGLCTVQIMIIRENFI